nr:PhnD/SsuA/transferrin family substrate-binding protein [Synechococcus elongatus]
MKNLISPAPSKQTEISAIPISSHSKNKPVQTGLYRDLLSRAIDVLGAGLEPFVQRAMTEKYGPRWHQHRHIRKITPGPPYGIEGPKLDPYLLLKIIDQSCYWQAVFAERLPGISRWSIDSLRDLRNRIAHYDGKDPLFESREQAEQLVITIKHLLHAIGSARNVAVVESIHQEIRRSYWQQLKAVLLGRHPVSPLVWLGIVALGVGSWRVVHYWQSPRLSQTKIVIGSPNQRLDGYEDLAVALEQRLIPDNFLAYLLGKNIDVELQTDRSYPLAVSRLRSRQWDVVFGYSPVVSMQALEAGYRHVGVMFPHNPGYAAIIFSRQDSDIQTLGDIRPTTTVALGDPFSASKFYLPFTMLQGRSLTLMKGLNNREILDAVRSGSADVGVAAADPSYFNPEKQGFRVLARSQRLPTSIVATSPNLSDRDRAVLTQTLLSLPEELRSADKANFAAGPEPDYRFLRRVIEQVRAWSACLELSDAPITFRCPPDQLWLTQGWVDAAAFRGSAVLLEVSTVDGRNVTLQIDRSLLDQLVAYREVPDLVGRRVRVSLLRDGTTGNQQQFTVLNLNQLEFWD